MSIYETNVNSAANGANNLALNSPEVIENAPEISPDAGMVGANPAAYYANYTTTQGDLGSSANFNVSPNPNGINPSANQNNLALAAGQPRDEFGPQGTDALTDGALIAGKPGSSQGGLKPGRGYATTQSPVNFDAIPNSRKEQLNGQAELLIMRYSTKPDARVAPNGTPLNDHPPEIDYNGFKNILTDLKNDRAYSDNEKAYIWSQIANQKGQSSLFGGWNHGTYRPTIAGSNPNVRDSDLWGVRAQDTPGHTVLPFTDTYHGFGIAGDGTPGMGYMTRDAAQRRIVDHETPRGLTSPLGFNRGDANASMAMVDAFHAYRDAPTGHKFESFANTWINGIVAR